MQRNPIYILTTFSDYQVYDYFEFSTNGILNNAGITQAKPLVKASNNNTLIEGQELG